MERAKGAQRKILVKSPEPGNKGQRKVEYTNYDAITMSRNYEEISSRENYYRKLSASIYHHAKNVGIIKLKINIK